MNNQHILNTLQKSAALLKQDFDASSLQEFSNAYRDYESNNVQDFKRDLIEAGNRLRIIYLDNQLSTDSFAGFLNDVEIPIVAFVVKGKDKYPVIFFKKKGKRYFEIIDEKNADPELLTVDNQPELYKDQAGKVVFLGVFSYKSLVSDDPDEGERVKPFTPFKRLIRLLSEEKKDISYIYVYAVFIGLISLSLPLGIQAVVSLISGGVFFSSVYVLITLVIIAVLAGGGLQVMQITLVEYLQRRVFIKAAFEFAFRVPRIKAEALLKYHAPELMNRFFDVLTIQKGLPKLLIDLSSGVIQIVFGLLLLSFYHPFFVFFGLFLLATLGGIFYATGSKGLASSMKESKYKYQVVHWLEELARTINSFKLSGNTSLPMKRTDTNANNYLKYRKVHFNVLVQQYSFIVLFKALVIGGVLIIGTILVVQREITLGQFVASEVIIILIVSSVEKIIMYMDVVYDVLTAVDKISQVTDLPLERSGGLTFPRGFDTGFEIKVKELSYKFPDNHDYTLKDIDLFVKKGERVCIAGTGGSGKTVLTNVISGLLTEFQGVVTINNFSVRDLDLNNLRDRVGKNVSQEDIFEGTILDNVLLAKPYAKPEDAIWALEKVGAIDAVNAMPHGLDTPVISGGKGLPSSLVNKLILARCLAKHPSLLILNDFFSGFSRPERMALMTMLIQPENPWTMWVVSNDPLVMAACDRIIVLSKGRLAAQGSFEELVNNGALKDILN
ncbi:ATP-binding cassette domain-containing protein [Fulvivirga kasyanovii]|uniref:ATP-binding cassette domain-containing protein n=1 Tax=Fulvivirga kasyanovii TaxID=396812 RepID=A0ABW9RLT0_9BACT|nr:ATP-binding cassette domain-containing protein [Fulvivirga kasyanovii]MTI24973.1 ATP-binding cassette domain-containing protein [Fulvivirga kasyanovii]